mgnify:CR=1 FL=1
MISVVLADDHHVVRKGIKALLEAEADIRVSGEAGSGSEAAQMAGQLKPDVMIIDLMLADMSGLAVIRQVRKRSPLTAALDPQKDGVARAAFLQASAHMFDAHVEPAEA